MALPSDPQTSPDANEVERTNTLAITSLPKQFFQPPILHVLRDHFATYGPLNRWVPLPGFSRIIVVYMREDDAETAKIHSDPIVLDGTDDRPQITLRVYRADPNPLLPMEPGGDLVPEANYLRPPEIEKNFLISPPGSPPVGWEPIKEDPPNAAPLADDLMVALRKLQMQEKSSSSPGVEVLIEPDDGGSGVGVYVQDCVDEEEEEAEEDWVYGQSAPGRAKWRPVTPMPPPAMMA